MEGSAGTTGILFIVVQLAIAVFMIVSMWKVFTKAGRPGWAILIPFYNIYIMLKIADKPGWWIILLFIPIVNIIIGIITLVGFAAKFDKGAGFIAGLIFLPFIFYPILAFGKARYQSSQT